MLFDIGSLHGDHARQKDKQKASVFAYIAGHGPTARKDITKNLGLLPSSAIGHLM